MIEFTVREIAVDSITVEYNDGSMAQVPIKGSLSKIEIESAIAHFAPHKDTFENVESVPFSIGQTYIVKTEPERVADIQAESDAELMTYADFRSIMYPLIGDQLDALYWSRNGDDTKLAEIDAKIAQIKSEYPKDMTPITKGEYTSIINSELE